MTELADYLAELITAQLDGRIPAPVPNNISVPTLFHIGKSHYLNVLLLKSIMQLEVEEAQKEKAKQEVLSCILKSATQKNELKKILDCFEKNRIKNHPMKGCILKQVYSVAELREMSDIDILVEENNMGKVQKLLAELGYELKYQEAQHDIYIKKPYMVVEIHRSLYNARIDTYQFNYFGTFQKSRLIPGKSYTYEFSKEDFYIYMIAHMAKHFYETGCGIRNLVDIYVFLEKYKQIIDKDYLNQELIKCGLYKFAQYMEELSYTWLQGKESTPFLDDLFEYMLNCGVYGKDENGIWNQYAKESVAKTKYSRIKLRMWYYFPPLYYMKVYYPWLKKAPFFLPIAWGIRGASGVFESKGKDKIRLLKVADPREIETIQKIYKEINLDFHA
ncbi:nucleotidyltransferase domain-containing protein [Clostridium sp. Marseille-P299]|uniref:nucleotidyltransferase domain-containing protein n=1 Tax=Clostridium sp. Marseille-P299 TaxID=1805477 RepID=UPI00082ADF55|nr:nucleotidyltransferase family protein [Clostridium sp. Marseille-P299]